jgi:CO/xanthine dehydrogenase Mo-binding subunit
MKSSKDYLVIGKGIPLVDSLEKAVGQAKYLIDYEEKGMLYGKILRSPYPHARILSINVNKARRLPGVKAVITHTDSPTIMFGVSDAPDKLPLAEDVVRFIGDEVAAVAATSEDIAEEALGLIQVEYELLPAVFDPIEAMDPGAPQIHEKANNISKHISRKFGNIEQGFMESKHIFKDRFTTHGVAHCCLEPHGCIAGFKPPGQYKFIITTQNTHTSHIELAKALGVPINKVSVSKLKIGGAFGGKLGIDPADVICGLLARRTAKTVKLIYTREEEFQATRIRHPSIIELKTGVDAEGRFVARQAKIIYDNGAYNSHGPRVLASACGKFTSLYGYTPHMKVEGYLVYTNNPYGGAFRGYGNPQITFAMESQSDIIAERLGIDPVEFHIKNSLKSDSTTNCGAKITSCGLKKCIRESARIIKWNEKRRARNTNRGVGMAIMIHTAAGSKGMFFKQNFSDASLKMNPDGSVVVLCGACDMGQGSDTILTQIAAEELGILPGDVTLEVSNTAISPMDLGSYASRVTFMAGNAIRNAASKLKRLLFIIASEMLEAGISDLVAREGRIFVKGCPESAIPIASVASRSYNITGSPLTARARFMADYPSPDPKTGYGSYSLSYSFACHMAEVEVNADTGRVSIINYVAAHDSGKIINPLMAEAQIEGSIMQGIGYTMTESLCLENGKVKNTDFFNYKVPIPLSVPAIEVFFVETEDPNGPYGAKGLGEPGLVPVAPAIVNAIYNATGVRLRDLPVVPEEIIGNLQKGKE